MTMLRRPISVWILIPAAAVAVGVAWFAMTSRGEELTQVLVDKGLRSGLEEFVVKRTIRQTVKELPVTEFLAIRGDSEAKVTVIEQAGGSVERYLDQRVFEINSQFNRGVSPYPGAFSQQNQCPKEFTPVVQNASGQGWQGRLITTFANRRRQFGVCEEKERDFEVAILVFSCQKTGTIFDLTVFTPHGQRTPAEILKDVACL